MNNLNEEISKTAWVNNPKIKTTTFILLVLVLLRSIVFDIVDSIHSFSDYLWNEAFCNIALMLACFFLFKPLLSKDNQDYSKRIAAGIGLLIASVSTNIFGIYFFAQETWASYFGSFNAIWQMAYISMFLQLLIVVYLLFVFFKGKNKWIGLGLIIDFFIPMHMANSYSFSISTLAAYCSLAVFVLMLFFFFAKKQRILLAGISLVLVLVSIIDYKNAYYMPTDGATINAYVVCLYLYLAYLLATIVQRVVLNIKAKGKFSFASLEEKMSNANKKPFSIKAVWIAVWKKIKKIRIKGFENIFLLALTAIFVFGLFSYTVFEPVERDYSDNADALHQTESQTETLAAEEALDDYALMSNASILRSFECDDSHEYGSEIWLRLDYLTMLSTVEAYEYYLDESAVKELEVSDYGDWWGEYKRDNVFIEPNYYGVYDKRSYTSNISVDIALGLSDDEGRQFCDDLYDALITKSAEFLCEKISEFNKSSLRNEQIGAVNTYMLYTLSDFIPAEVEDSIIIDILNSIGFNGYEPYVLVEDAQKNNLHQSILAETFDGTIPTFDEPVPEESFVENSEDVCNIMGEYVGEYMNNGGGMMMTMYIDDAVFNENGRVRVSAIIAFKPYDKTYVAKSGTYFASGYVDVQAGTIVMNPDKWISEQPEGYDMLGFKGFYNNGKIDALLDREMLRELTFEKK